MSEKFDLNGLKRAAVNGHGLQAHSVIFRVKQGFYGMMDAKKKMFSSIYLDEGELIEFRYEHSAHCRNMKNEYFMIDPVVLAYKCTPFARIHDSVRMENKKKLKDIVEYQLCDLFEGVLC